MHLLVLVWRVQVRAAFHRHLSAVGPSLGGEGLVAIIHPFLDRMVTGPEEAGEPLGAEGSACSEAHMCNCGCGCGQWPWLWLLLH